MAVSLTLASSGVFGPALAHARDALRIATGIEHAEWIAATHGAFGQIYLLLLEPVRANSHLETALREAQALGSAIWMKQLAPYLALAHHLRREFGRAEALLTSVVSRERQPGNFFERQAARVWGEMALAQGEASRALAIAQ